MFFNSFWNLEAGMEKRSRQANTRHPYSFRRSGTSSSLTPQKDGRTSLNTRAKCLKLAGLRYACVSTLKPSCETCRRCHQLHRPCELRARDALSQFYALRHRTVDDSAPGSPWTPEIPLTPPPPVPDSSDEEGQELLGWSSRRFDALSQIVCLDPRCRVRASPATVI